MDTSDRSMDYDKNFIRPSKEKKNHLASRLNKFQGIVNQTGASSSSSSVYQADLAHRVKEQILEEMKQLCQVIQSNGKQQDGVIIITFGDLFEMYANISDKLVGILLKARRHGYLTFQGEMLLQNRDENVAIHLIRSI